MKMPPPVARFLSGCRPVFPAALFVLTGTGCAADVPPSGSGEIPDLRTTESELRRHVYALAGDIGERNLYRPQAMKCAAAYIEGELTAMGYVVRRQPVFVRADEVYSTKKDTTVFNLEVIRPGTDPEPLTLVVGAHYDTRVGMDSWDSHGPAMPSRVGTPGANDNASGVAALLRIARTLRDTPTRNTLRFVAYANEEPPFFRTDAMGSRVHARALAAEMPKNRVLGMIALETLGCYSPRVNRKRDIAIAPDAIGLPDRCDYVAFLSTLRGRELSDACARDFAGLCRFPVRPVAFPYLTKGVAWSDDWAYMKEGFSSFAATDTAYLRCDDYHESSDTPEKLDYAQFAEVVTGLGDMIRTVANRPEISPAK